MKQQGLIKAASIFAILISAVVILIYAKGFLIPLTFGAILSMLLLPVTKWLETKGVNNVIAIILSILLLVLFFSGVIALLTWQIAGIGEDFTKFQDQLIQKYQQARQFISEHLGISHEKQQEMLKKQQSAGGGAGKGITAVLSGIGGFITDIILVLVYIFLFIFFRGRLKNFIVKIVPKEEQKNAVTTINSAQKVSQKYLTGMFMMIVCLWIMYGIGFTIAGVKNAFFFAVLCGLLEIIPFVGNITGTAFTVIMSLVQGQGSNVIVGILITYAIVQFLQTYILEPLVVGAEVNINPLFTIVGLVAGETLWGIAGMVVAIPLMGIFKIVCDHVDPLKPYGYLIGQEKKEGGLKEKIGRVFSKIKK